MRGNKKIILFIGLILLTVNVFGQFEPDRLRLNIGLGTSSYLGDLIKQRVPIMKQVSADFTAGITYDVSPDIPQLRARLNVSLLGIRGNDNLNPRLDSRARNLNFKSTVWEIAPMLEYDLVDREVYNIVPYVFAGVGIYHFNPYTYLQNFNGKVYLHDIGTEGQFLEDATKKSLGIGNNSYKLTQLNIPLGVGLRYEVSETFSLGIELNYRILFTDHLDDVSANKYIPKGTFLASPAYNHPYNGSSWTVGQLAEALSYRGISVDGFDYNYNLRRGNPNNKDAFYSLQIMATFRLDNLPFGNNGPFSGRNRSYGY